MTSGSQHVLVVEDDAAITDFIERGLRAEGFDVVCASDGTEGETVAVSGEVDLVILDILLPSKDGFDVLRAIRAIEPTLPVIMLSALGSSADRVAGLDAGATDYLSKPFSFDELVARVRAHLRTPSQDSVITRLDGAGITLDLLARRVMRDGIEVSLTVKEFDLLAYFMRHADQALSRTQILRAVWDYGFDPRTNVVEVYVRYLRNKLAAVDHPAPIQTIRSVGYRFSTKGYEGARETLDALLPGPIR